MFMVLTSWLRVIVWDIWFTQWMQNSARRLPTFRPTKPSDLSRWPACRPPGNYIHHRHLSLLSQKADTHFTIPQRAESWVDLDGWLHTHTVYVPANRHVNPQTVTHPSSNRAQCRLTTLLKSNALTATPGCHRLGQCLVLLHSGEG